MITLSSLYKDIYFFNLNSFVLCYVNAALHGGLDCISYFAKKRDMDILKYVNYVSVCIINWLFLRYKKY